MADDPYAFNSQRPMFAAPEMLQTEPLPDNAEPPPLLSERGLGESSREQQQQMAQPQQRTVDQPSDWAGRWIEMQMGGYSISGRDRVKGRNYGKGKGGKDMTEKDAFTHWSGKLAGMTPEQREVIRRRMEGLDTQSPQGKAHRDAFRAQQTGTPTLSRNGVSSPGAGSSTGSSSSGSGGQSPQQSTQGAALQVPDAAARDAAAGLRGAMTNPGQRVASGNVASRTPVAPVPSIGAERQGASKAPAPSPSAPQPAETRMPSADSPKPAPRTITMPPLAGPDTSAQSKLDAIPKPTLSTPSTVMAKDLPGRIPAGTNSFETPFLASRNAGTANSKKRKS